MGFLLKYRDNPTATESISPQCDQEPGHTRPVTSQPASCTDAPTSTLGTFDVTGVTDVTGAVAGPEGLSTNTSQSWPTSTLDIDAATQHFSTWDPSIGVVMQDTFAIDVETTAIQQDKPRVVPKLVLAAVYDGHRGYFLDRSTIEEFLRVHDHQSMIIHNATFDLAVIDHHCPFLQIYDRVEQDRVFDTQLLHRLYKLATEGTTASGKGQSTLERCAMDYLYVDLPKDLQDHAGNSVRMSYGRWLDQPISAIEPVYLEYLAKDVIVTQAVFQVLKDRIETILANCHGTWGFVSPHWLAKQVNQWGWLTHHLQLKGAIVLNEIYRNGMCVDRDMRDELSGQLQLEADQKLKHLQTFDYAPGPGSGNKLQEKIAAFEENHPDAILPMTNSGKYQSDRTVLNQLADEDPFFAALLELREIQKLGSSFLSKMDRPRLHPSFDSLKTTGRTSSFGELNAQNLPRDDRIRACFVPSPGHVFVDADYATVELATLAQACLTQFGLNSQMAKAINKGEDLHRLVAAKVAGQQPEDVSDEDRQRAKPINFGKPGGMGNDKLQQYAKDGYGIDLSDEQVAQLTDAWFQMFPEMRGFLADDENVGEAVARYFDLTPQNFFEHTGVRTFVDHPENKGVERLPHPILGRMALKVLGYAEPRRQTGIPYSDIELDYFWTSVNQRIDDLPNDAVAGVANRLPSPELRHIVVNHTCCTSVFTLTGRLRSKASYCARHNTIFQGLAADGAKLALWRLWREGFRIVNFVHDQVLIEVPVDQDLHESARQIQDIMISSMKLVTPDVRIDVEAAATRRWYKKAKPVHDPITGQLQIWEPQSAVV